MEWILWVGGIGAAQFPSFCNLGAGWEWTANATPQKKTR
jgi:hypothetical protein